MGKSLDECLGCKYCFLKNYRHENMIYPDDDKIPVSINMFYGDPMLQLDTTLEILEGLEEREHKGCVVITTKGDFSEFPKRDFNLDVWVGFSTFGINHKIDGGNLETFYHNLELTKEYPYTFFIGFRPIIKGVNDTKEAIDNVIPYAVKYNFPVVCNGLAEKNGWVPRKFLDKIKVMGVNPYRKTSKLLIRYKRG